MMTKSDASIVMEDYMVGNQWMMYGLSMHTGFQNVALYFLCVVINLSNIA